MAAEFLLTALTRNPEVIRASDRAGVDRIGTEIGRLDQDLREDRAVSARLSDHRLDDLRVVAANVTRAEVFVRLNPLHEGTREEIDQAIELGAHVVMLPYCTEPREVRVFLDLLGGRAKPVLLVETAAAAARIADIISLPGLTEVMLGLSDLHRSLGLSHPFEVLTLDMAAHLAAKARDAGLRFGFGGVGRIGDQTLPVPADLVYAQYPRMGATSAWLARSFYRGIGPDQIPEAVRQLRERLAYWSRQHRDVLEEQRVKLATRLRSMKEGSS